MRRPDAVSDPRSSQTPVRAAGRCSGSAVRHVAYACPRRTNRRYAGQPVHSVKRTLATAIRAAGLHALPDGHLRFHDLRHTFASWALAEGGDLKLVQDALGHKHITTTARYAHLVSGRREAVANAVADRLLAPPAEKA
jgi:integrase